MRQSYGIIFWRFMFYAVIGLLLEVFWGVMIGLSHGDFDLRGNTSLWMILDYGLLGMVLMPIRAGLIRWRLPLLARGVVYMLGIYIVEYISGTIFTACGLNIWNYHGFRYELHGQIALFCAPLWYCLGLGAELIYPKINACAHIFSNTN